MPEIVKNCLLCNGKRNRLFDTRSFAGRKVENRICLSCGFVFQSPRMTSDEADNFYTSEYRQLYQGISGPNPKDLHMQKLRAGSLASFAGRHINQVSRHLDIGSSAGSLIQSIHQTYVSESVGIEPGEAYREFARDAGLMVYPSIKDLQVAGEAKFDLVTMSHVLEHILDPLAYLVHLREDLLTSDGCLMVEVPNLYFHDSFEVAHMSSFSIHTLHQLVRKAGFEMVAYQKHGFPRSKIIPYFLTVICSPSQANYEFRLKPERFVALKRQLGLFIRRLISHFFPTLAWKPLAEEKDQEPAL
jgi:2-polyprenyl-3-methyl-5-hydroxy-6-metoxy-1,4-benzoquinol methylase